MADQNNPSQQPNPSQPPNEPAGKEPELPDAHFGSVSEDKVDWRASGETDEDAGEIGDDDDADDDEELAETPEDVIAMLGFDPLDSDEEEAEEAERSDAAAKERAAKLDAILAEQTRGLVR